MNSFFTTLNYNSQDKSREEEDEVSLLIIYIAPDKMRRDEGWLVTANL